MYDRLDRHKGRLAINKYYDEYAASVVYIIHIFYMNDIYDSTYLGTAVATCRY